MLSNEPTKLSRAVMEFVSARRGIASFAIAELLVFLVYGPSFNSMPQMHEMNSEGWVTALLIYVAPGISAGICFSEKVNPATKIPFGAFLAIYSLIMIGAILFCGLPPSCHP